MGYNEQSKGFWCYNPLARKINSSYLKPNFLKNHFTQWNIILTLGVDEVTPKNIEKNVKKYVFSYNEKEMPSTPIEDDTQPRFVTSGPPSVHTKNTIKSCGKSSDQLH